MADAGTLPLLFVVAIGGAVVAPLLPATLARAAAMALMATLLAITVDLVVAFDGQAAAGAGFSLPFMPSIGVALRFAVDGLNVWLLLLTALLPPVVLACAWSTAEGESRLFVGLLLWLQAALFGTFLSQNLLVLFVLWEAVLIPMVLLIFVFGGERRRDAAMRFFLVTMAGSVLLLAAVIALGAEHRAQAGRWSFDFADLMQLRLSPAMQTFVFVAVALACAVKTPLVPFHAWLPLAYREASPSGTALMAGVLSKMGAFGFLKLALPLAPVVAAAWSPLLVALAVASLLYGAVLALRQAEFKMVVAYASLSHMGTIVLGAFSGHAVAAHGALLQIASHGVVVAGLFLLLGLLAQRGDPQATALASRAPRLAVLAMVFVLASLGLPLTSGFTAEFLVLLGAFGAGWAQWTGGAGSGQLVAAVLASTAVVLGAAYMLRLARSMVFGSRDDGAAPPSSASTPRLRDLTLREALACAPLVAVVVAVGVWPAPWMARSEAAVALLVDRAPLPDRIAAHPRADHAR